MRLRINRSYSVRTLSGFYFRRVHLLAVKVAADSTEEQKFVALGELFRRKAAVENGDAHYSAAVGDLRLIKCQAFTNETFVHWRAYNAFYAAYLAYLRLVYAFYPAPVLIDARIETHKGVDIRDAKPRQHRGAPLANAL